MTFFSYWLLAGFFAVFLRALNLYLGRKFVLTRMYYSLSNRDTSNFFDEDLYGNRIDMDSFSYSPDAKYEYSYTSYRRLKDTSRMWYGKFILALVGGFFTFLFEATITAGRTFEMLWSWFHEGKTETIERVKKQRPERFVTKLDVTQ